MDSKKRICNDAIGYWIGTKQSTDPPRKRPDPPDREVILHCSVCERQTSLIEMDGKICNMLQPDGTECNGVFRKTRIGDWIETYSGVKFYPLDPRPEDILIQDIAHALSMTCRFTGHPSRFYSVAEHCCHVHDIAPTKFRREALLHDAAEAYISDVSRPVKQIPPLRTWYKAAEDTLMKAISERFKFQWPLPECIKDIDDAMLYAEKEELMNESVIWDTEYKGSHCWLLDARLSLLPKIEWDWERAKHEFFDRAYELRPRLEI